MCSFNSCGTRAKPSPTCASTVCPFDLARTVFNDPKLLTIADLEHSHIEDRWFSIGCASNTAMENVIGLEIRFERPRPDQSARRKTGVRSITGTWQLISSAPFPKTLDPGPRVKHSRAGFSRG